MSNTEEADNAQSIVVAVRVRPLSSKEIGTGQKNCCNASDDTAVSIKKVGDKDAYLKSQVNDTIHNFSFDHVFGEESTQREIYHKAIQKFVPKIHLGQHVTIFAYGATGAGKTHTMFGDLESDDFSADSETGIIVKSVKDLLEQTEQRKKFSPPGEVWITSFCFLEVYNEQVFDLLEYTGKDLKIREDADRGVIQVTGLSETPIQSVDHFIGLVRHGQKYRKMEPTLANVVSSRSHAILQVIVRCLQRNKFGKETLTESKLSLIDLAGSEKASRTGSTAGIRQQEGANINKSLLALGNCINALAENCSLPPGSSPQKRTNVKFRDSKLTHLLKSSLEGNSHLVMLANINPSDVTYEDSLKTLSYAKRAKFIKVNPLVKANLLESTSLEREIQLRAENELFQKKVDEQDAELVLLREQLEQLQCSLRQYQEKEEDKPTLHSISCEAILFPENESVGCQVRAGELEPNESNSIACQTMPVTITLPVKTREFSCQTSDDLLPVKTVTVVQEKRVEVKVPVEVRVEVPVPVEVRVEVPIPTPVEPKKKESRTIECQTDKELDKVILKYLEQGDGPLGMGMGLRSVSSDKREKDEREIDINQIYFVNELRKMRKGKNGKGNNGKRVSYDSTLVRYHSADSILPGPAIPGFLPSFEGGASALTVKEKIEQFEKNRSKQANNIGKSNSSEHLVGVETVSYDDLMLRLVEEGEEREEEDNYSNSAASGASTAQSNQQKEDDHNRSVESMASESDNTVDILGQYQQPGQQQQNSTGKDSVPVRKQLQINEADGKGKEKEGMKKKSKKLSEEDQEEEEESSLSTLSDNEENNNGLKKNKSKNKENKKNGKTAVLVEITDRRQRGGKKNKGGFWMNFLCGAAAAEEVIG
jgi:hypothetical protein